MKYLKKRGHCDYSLLFIIILLLAFGLVMIYSTSSYSAQLKIGNSAYYLIQQGKATFIGLICLIAMAKIDYHLWYRSGIVIAAFLGSCVTVLLVLTPMGLDINGARRWLDLGITSFQPAEFVKVGVILFMAYYISKSSRQASNFSYIIKILFYAAIPSGLILVVTKNMSSAIIIMAIAFIMLFVASPKYKPFILLVALLFAAAAVFLIVGGGFRMGRIKVWMNPEKYSQNGGYQVLQGLYAIGSGGIFGKGLGQSIQKLGYVPEAQNDMVFSIICEELGFVGAMAVIIMFIFMIWRFMVIASNAPDLFGSMLVVGIMAHISVQVILNIAVVTNTMPNTGITLPFISYGGTSVLFLLGEMGLALSVSKSVYNQENV